MMPWKLLAEPATATSTWLLGYSGGLGSIAGVLICDYWIIRRTRLVLADLYRPRGVQPTGRRLGRTGRPSCHGRRLFVAWIGLFVPALHWLYDAAWFSGTLSSGLVYGLWMWKRRDPAAAKMS